VLFLGTIEHSLTNSNGFLLKCVQVIGRQDEDIFRISLILDGNLDFLFEPTVFFFGISSLGIASAATGLPLATTAMLAARLTRAAAAFAGAG
jgi:hypothetical protein